MSEQRDSASTKRSLDDQSVASESKKAKATPPASLKMNFNIPKKPSVPGSIKIGLGKPSSKIAFGSGFKMGLQKKTSQEVLTKQQAVVPPKQAKTVPKAASAFADEDDDSEEEEMPPEAKMRMRNIGRETPTSAGPNSFGKSRMGFSNNKKLYEKMLDKALD